MYRKIFLSVIIFFALCSASSANFIPEEQTISVSELKPEMTGYILTVVKGREPSKIPVKIISIIPQKPGVSIRNEILIKFLDSTKLAQGMSGSPLYFQDKLAGAIRSGWEFSDHTLACAAPIEDMCRVFDFPDESEKMNAPAKLTLDNIIFSGISINNISVKKLADTLGLTLTQGISAGSYGMKVNNTKLKPGDSVTALLVWGDVEMGAVGTVTATSRDGKFLAFGHPFMKRGNVLYPAAKTYIHDIVNSTTFPFKLASPEAIHGTFIQDREAGIGGRFGYFGPSISAELLFRDLDSKTESRYKFRVAPDEFTSHTLIENIYSGLAEEAWGRKGQGTMSVNVRIDGKDIPNGWTRKDIFFSEENILSHAFEQAKAIINAYLTQPFSETMPAGFSLTVEATQRPKVLMIEDVETVTEAKPGEDIEIKVKLRNWRRDPFEQVFTMKIPDDASEGVTELIVRGGSIQPMHQIAVEEGLKSINSLERMLAEMKAADANNEIILELNSDRLEQALKEVLNRKNRTKKAKPSKNADFLPEEEEYLSETKERRIKEGSLKIFSTDYFIDGMMKRIIHVEK